MEVGVRLFGILLLYHSANAQSLLSLCSASFETACSVTTSYNLVVRMQRQFQSANKSHFFALATEMNQGKGLFVQPGTSEGLYGFLWMWNGTCVGHPYVCTNGSISMQEYIYRNGYITTPFLEKLIVATAYYAGGPQPDQTQGIGSWLFYYWANELKRGFFLPVLPEWSEDAYYVGAGFNDVAAAGGSLQSPTHCSPDNFALCASDLAQQLAQEFRLRILREVSIEGLTEFFTEVSNHTADTRINGMFHGDIYGISGEGSDANATILAHDNASLVGEDIVGTLGADSDSVVWSRFAVAALGHKFGAWVQYSARSSNGTWVERFSFCLNVFANQRLIDPYSSLLIVSSFDRIYDARAAFSVLEKEDSGVVWIDRSVVWFLSVANERKEQYQPGDLEKFIRTGINAVFTGGVVQPITRQPDGRFRIVVEVDTAGPHILNVSVQEKYQNKNFTVMMPVAEGPVKVYVYDPTNRLVLSELVGYVFIGWTTLTAVMIIGFMTWTVINRATRVVFASSADFMLMTAGGLLLTLVSVLIAIITPDKFTCDFQLSLWFQHLGSVLAESAMVTKAYRLHRIFNNAKLKKVVLPRTRLYLLLGIPVAFQMVMLLVATFVFPSQLGNFGAGDVECIVSSEVGFLALKAAMLFLEAIPVMGAGGLAYKLQDIPMRYNESKWLGLACINWVIVVIFYLVTFFARVDAFVAQFFMCFCVVWVSFCTAILLFVPKIIQLRNAPPVTKESQYTIPSGLEAKLLPESILDTIKARENALSLARAAQTRAIAKLQSAGEAVKKCEAQLFDSVAELAFQSQGQNDAWKVIEGYQQTHAYTRASINEQEVT